MSTLSSKSRKKWLVPALILAGAVVVYLLFLVVSNRYWSKKYAEGYVRIQVGDPREWVTGLMGNPAKMTSCGYEPFTDKKEGAKYRETCKERYWYGGFLKEYVISFDKEGRVINKSSAVSP